MDINFDNLNKITVIEKLLIKLFSRMDSMNQKKWMTTKEAAEHTTYSKYSIDRFVETKDLKEGIHYHQKHGKRIFSSNALDLWVEGLSPELKEETKTTINNILNSVVKDPNNSIRFR